MRPKPAFAAFLSFMAVAPLLVPEFHVTLLNYIGLATLVTLGLVVLTGVVGLISFGQQAFVGLAAYTTAVMTTVWGISPWVTLPVALLFTLVAAMILGAIILRLSGHYLALTTIAWAIAAYYLFGKFELLGQYNGIANLPALSIFGWKLDTGAKSYYLIWVVTTAALVAAHNLLDSRSGRAIRALRFRGVMAESFGVNTAALKYLLFIYAALLAGISGWLYAHFLRLVSPGAFGVNAGIDYLFMAVIGGATQVWGAVLGATILTLLKEWLQDLLPKLFGQTGNYEIVVFGLLVLVLLHRARNGLLPVLARFLPPGPPLRIASDAAPLARRSPPAPGATLLEVRAAQKRLGGLLAVDRLSFEQKSGEILGLIGPNGAGKSTMFNLVTGVLRCDGGEILFRGERIEHLPSRDIARLGICRTFQHVNLIGNMTVLENAAIGAHLRGKQGTLAAMLRLERDEDARLLAEAAMQLKRVGLGAHLASPAGSLALGQQRVVEIARALCADPLLLLLDEPAAGLRYAEKAALADLLRKLRDEGMTILLVEHDMDFVMGLVDRLVVMDFGAKLAQGIPAEIQADAKVLQAYLGGVA